MPTNSFSWLHLTDFHYGLKGQDCLWPTLREPFLDSLDSLRERCGPWDAVLFTGDLVQSGETAQFEKMQDEVLDPLWKRLSELGSGDAVLLAVPGNHDLYRPNPNEDNAAIDVLLEKDGFQRIKTKFWDQTAGQYRRVINDAFAAYRQWWNKAPHRPGAVKAGALPGDFSASLQAGGRRIGIVGLNTTFLQLAGGDYEGRLVWDARQLHAVCEGGVDTWSKQHDVCLLLTHQGPNWLTPEARKQGESEIAPAGRFAAHLFGHQHETEITYTHRGGSRNATRLLQARSVFGMDKFGDPPKIQRAHGYTAGRIELGETEAQLRLWPRMASNTIGPWRFIPDHDHAELEKDEGTPPEPVAVRYRAGGAPPAKAVSIGAAPAKIVSPSPAVAAPHYDRRQRQRQDDPDQAGIDHPRPTKRLQQHLAFVFGVVFVVILLVLAIAFPSPTPFQYTVFRVVLALAAAGVAATIPGFLQLTIADWILAGGALAVFAIVFFYNPAALVVPEPRPEPTSFKEGAPGSTSGRGPNSSPGPSTPGLEETLSAIRNAPVRGPRPSPESSVTRDRESIAQPARVEGFYRVHLLVPTSMSNAAVWLDGREARILKRTATLITIEVFAGGSNHQLKLEKEGMPTCSETTAITEDGLTLTPCQR